MSHAEGVLDLGLLPAFDAFADARSFAKAARRMGCTEPAVHQQIRRLEAAVGVALYQKVGRGIGLTSAGMELARFARQTLLRRGEALLRIRGTDKTAGVVLAASSRVVVTLLGAAIRTYLEAPVGPLRLELVDDAAALELVRERRVDIAVVPIDAVPRGLEGALLTRVESMIAARDGHLLLQRRSVQLTDLGAFAVVPPPVGDPRRRVLEEAAVDAVVDVDSVETAAHLAGLGVGVAVVDASTRLPAGVHARPLPELGCAEYRVIFRRELYIDSSAWVLRELLVTNAGAWKRAPDVAWRRR